MDNDRPTIAGPAGRLETGHGEGRVGEPPHPGPVGRYKAWRADNHADAYVAGYIGRRVLEMLWLGWALAIVWDYVTENTVWLPVYIGLRAFHAGVLLWAGWLLRKHLEFNAARLMPMLGLTRRSDLKGDLIALDEAMGAASKEEWAGGPPLVGSVYPFHLRPLFRHPTSKGDREGALTKAPWFLMVMGLMFCFGASLSASVAMLIVGLILGFRDMGRRMLVHGAKLEIDARPLRPGQIVHFAIIDPGSRPPYEYEMSLAGRVATNDSKLPWRRVCTVPLGRFPAGGNVTVTPWGDDVTVSQRILQEAVTAAGSFEVPTEVSVKEGVNVSEINWYVQVRHKGPHHRDYGSTLESLGRSWPSMSVEFDVTGLEVNTVRRGKKAAPSEEGLPEPETGSDQLPEVAPGESVPDVAPE